MHQGDTVVLGTRKGVLVLGRAKDGRWRVERDAHLGAVAPYAAVDPRDGALWTGIEHGHWGTKLHRSRDMGRTWEELPAPQYPEGAEIKPGKPAKLKYPWVFAFGAASQPGRIYLGTIPGGLFVSDDGGASWAINDALWNRPQRFDSWFGGGFDDPGVHSVLVDPRNPKRWIVGVSVGGVYETTDDGKSWTIRNSGLRADYLPDPHPAEGHDPHLVASNRAQPDTLWQQNHCGIFVTEDGGKQWRSVEEKSGPAKFGFAVAVDERDARTAWVVPAINDDCRVAVDKAMCVCRTEDAGKSWKALRKGLPQEACYDVTFRHALDVCGDRLMFGTTTGNVFVSDDRGESWSSVGSAFPPVYSVRFVRGS